MFVKLMQEGNPATQEVAAMTLANLVRLDQGQKSCIDAGGVQASPCPLLQIPHRASPLLWVEDSGPAAQ